MLAVYDPEYGEYQTVCKLATGFSDENLLSFFNALKETEVKQAPRNFRYEIEPDVWFSPKFIWEIKAADLSISPVHTAAIGKISDKGIGLRFPRFIRLRTDKNPTDATSSQQIAQMYNNQSSITLNWEEDLI